MDHLVVAISDPRYDAARPPNGLRTLSVRTVAALSLGAAGVLGTLVATAIATGTATRELETRIGAETASIAAATASALDRGMFARWRDLQVLAALDQVRELSSGQAARQRVLESLKATLPDYAWIGIADTNGRVAAATGGLLVGQDVSARPWFEQGRRSATVQDVHEAKLLASYLSPTDGEPLRFVDVATPLSGADGRASGVLGAHLHWRWAADTLHTLKSTLPEPANRSEILVLSRKGRVLLGPRGQLGQTVSLPEERSKRWWSRERTANLDRFIGVAATQGYRAYPGLGWTVIVRRDAGEALRSVAALRRTMLLGGTGVALLLAVLAWIAAGAFARPLQRLARAATALAFGEPPQPLRGGPRELVQVSNALCEAGEELERRADALAAKNRELAALNSGLEAQVIERTEELAQSRKLESLGQLTGGVAHDFNNLLTPIIGSLDMLQRRAVGGEREQRLIAGALQSGERARTLVSRLLAFARRQHLASKNVDLTRLVGEMRELIEGSIGPSITARVDIPPGLPPVRVDPGQLEHALLNLSLNAREAMPDGGTLTIEAHAEQVESGNGLGLAPGDYVRLAVVDTGTGMDATTLSRAVEPFFSSRGIGKGTGLGLSMVHGLAGQSGGALALSSTPGKGTRAEVWLPQAEAAVAAERASLVAAPVRAVGAKTVLLVDDEPLVRAATAEMLLDLGYSVVEADSGEAALVLLGQKREIDALVTDFLMPGMTGAELVRKVRARRASLPALIITGYSRLDEIGSEVPRLAKPFRQKELADAVGGLLEPNP